MKKIIAFAIAAICCFASCTKEECEAVYIINHGVTYQSGSGDRTSLSAKLVDDFTQATIAFDNNHKSQWEWKVVVKNKKYTAADNAAKAKFEKVQLELDALNEQWQKNFDACSDDGYIFKQTQHLTLKRVSSESATVCDVTYDMHCN